MVMYPRPQDMEAFDHLYQDEGVTAGDGLLSEYARSFETFEKLYQEEHVPMIFEKLVGKTRFVATKVVGTADGTRPPFYRIAEVHFPWLQTLRHARSPTVAGRPWPMPSRSPVAGRRFFSWRKRPRSFLAAYLYGTG
jgi:uncharacterized protein (TIGR02118 family)